MTWICRNSHFLTCYVIIFDFSHFSQWVSIAQKNQGYQWIWHAKTHIFLCSELSYSSFFMYFVWLEPSTRHIFLNFNTFWLIFTPFISSVFISQKNQGYQWIPRVMIHIFLYSEPSYSSLFKHFMWPEVAETHNFFHFMFFYLLLYTLVT